MTIDEQHIKSFQGRDFLTWLLMRSLCDNNKFKLEGIEPFELTFEKNITFVSEFDTKEKTTLRGEENFFGAGIAIALAEGKKVERANISVTLKEQTWKTSITSENLDLSALRTTLPKNTFPEQVIQIRLSAYELFRSFFDKLFIAFLKTRLSEEKWKVELKKIHNYVKSQIESVAG